jgi:acyl carrier protein
VRFPGARKLLQSARTCRRGKDLDVQREILKVLDEVLSLNGRASAMRRESPLLGVIPELDSMAVVTLITTLEDRFGLAIADDDLDASAFTTVGSLTDFVSARLTG